jgi:hypothetical protein
MVQRFGLSSRQTRSQARRMNLRPPQTFIRIDISHAPQHALIEQQRLDSRAPRPDSRHKFLRIDFQRIGPKPMQLLLERHSRKVRHAPKTSGVRVTQLPSVIEQETRMRMLLARLRSRMRRDMPGHPKMDKQRSCSAIAIGCPDRRRVATPYSRWGHQPKQHEFSVSLDGCNLPSGQMLFQRDRIINEIRFPQRDGQNSPAQNALS